MFEKVGEPDLPPGPLHVVLHPPPVVPECEIPVRRRLAAGSDGGVVGRAEEVGDGEALRLGVGHHFVLHAPVSVVAPRLNQNTISDDVSDADECTVRSIGYTPLANCLVKTDPART